MKPLTVVSEHDDIDAVFQLSLFQTVHHNSNYTIRFHQRLVCFVTFWAAAVASMINNIHVQSDESWPENTKM